MSNLSIESTTAADPALASNLIAVKPTGPELGLGMSDALHTAPPTGTKKNLVDIGTEVLVTAVKMGARENVPLSAVDRIYPHLFDGQSESGKLVVLIHRALTDARLALDSYGEGDLQGVGSSLAVIAVTMSEAFRISDFNDSLAAVISFIRRASLATPATDLSRPSLNSLIQALSTMANNPAIDLEDAGNIVDSLEKEGWLGESSVSNELISALLGELDTGHNTSEQFALLSPVHNVVA